MGWKSFAGQAPAVKLSEAGLVDCDGQRFPILALHVSGGSRRALLVAGIHGDEPAGPEALHRFFSQGVYKSFTRRWSFDLLPLVSPCGHLAASRSTPRCDDPNREFARTGVCDEAAIVARYVEGERYDLLLSLHEDCDADGIYLYDSGRRDRAGFLEAMSASHAWLVAQETAGHRVNSEPFIEGSINHGGIIVGSDTDFPAFEPTMYRTGRADRAVVLETPARWALDVRVAIHLSALRHYLE